MLGSFLTPVQLTDFGLQRYAHWPVQEKTWLGWFDTLTCGAVCELDSLILWATAIERTACMLAFLMCYVLAFWEWPAALGVWVEAFACLESIYRPVEIRALVCAESFGYEELFFALFLHAHAGWRGLGAVSMCVCLGGGLGMVLWGLRQGGELLRSRLCLLGTPRQGGARQTRLIRQLLCALVAVALTLALGVLLVWLSGGLG